MQVCKFTVQTTCEITETVTDYESRDYHIKVVSPRWQGMQGLTLTMIGFIILICINAS
jgi:hypothetical protein